MTWFYTCDSFHSHPKVLGLSFAAIGVWNKCGSWCADHLTDGLVPTKLLNAWHVPAEAIAELLECGLWEPATTGYQFHDWLEYQPSRAGVLDKRRKDAERKARGFREGSAKTPRGVPPESEQTPASVATDSDRPSPSPSPSPVPIKNCTIRAPVREEQSSIQVGHDFMFAAIGLDYGGQEWNPKLDRIGIKPVEERERALVAIQADVWCQSNRYSVDPDHVLKRWLRYANGNPVVRPVSLPLPGVAKARERLAKLSEELGQLKAARRALGLARADPDRDSKLFDLDKRLLETENARDRAQREAEAT